MNTPDSQTPETQRSGAPVVSVAPPAKPLNFLEQELADHTCSFGDRCAVRVRAKQMGPRPVMGAFWVACGVIAVAWALTEVTRRWSW